MSEEILSLNKDYGDFLQSLKTRIQQAQTRAALAVNRELVLLYWQIGREILERQNARGWGAKVIEQLSKDLRSEFPQMKGFSARNLKYMRKFAENYPDEQFVQEPLAQITWYHNITLLEKVKDTLCATLNRVAINEFSRVIYCTGLGYRVSGRIIDN